MKSSIERIRKYALHELLLHRSLYKQYCDMTNVTDMSANIMYNQYIRVMVFCNCGLISVCTAARAFHMYKIIRDKRGDK